MNKKLFLFIKSYNDFMRNNGNQELIYNFNDIEKNLFKSYNDTINIYDKVSKLYPSIKKYIMDNYFKIYLDGNQELLLKNQTCNICEENFNHISAVKMDENNIVHSCCYNNKITKLKALKINNKFDKTDKCLLCKNKFSNNKNIMYRENTFYHKECYTNTIKNAIKDKKCSVCNELLYDLNSELIYCYETKNKDDLFHSKCATKKHIQKSIQTKFNKCSVCNFYVEGKEYIHDECI